MRSIFLSCTVLVAASLQAQTPTWHEDISCIVYTHCAPCHHDGGAGHFSLTSYNDAAFWRNEMRAATQVRYMPPWPPDPGYRSLAHERVLSQSEIDLIAAWVDGGYPEGNPMDALSPPSYTSAWALDQPDITSIMEDYVIPASSSDNYRCFVLPINDPVESFITAMEIVPGNREMVHHVLIFSDNTGQAAQLDAQTIEPGYSSFGGVGVPSARFLGVWLPGDGPFTTPPGMGVRLLANSDIILQMHYPATSLPQVDSTRINLMVSTGPGIRPVTVDALLTNGGSTLQNGPFVIPAGQMKTFHTRTTLNAATTLTAISPHAHLVCVSMKSFAIVPSGDTIPLVDIPQWDFRWQSMYQFRRPIYLPAGTQLHGFATYDNTVNNPSNPNSPPQNITFGEATTDEMLIFFFARTPGVPSDAEIVVDTTSTPSYYMDCFGGGLSVGLPEIPEDGPAMAVWPSPTSDMLHVEVPSGSGSLVVLDMTGRAVLRKRVQGARAILQLATLPPGSYVLKYLSDQGVHLRSRFIVE